MHLEIIPKDWHKRRSADLIKVYPVSATVEGFEYVHNHFCTLIIEYNDKSTKRLLSRVLYNNIKGTWAIDGMEVAVRVITGE